MTDNRNAVLGAISNAWRSAPDIVTAANNTLGKVRDPKWVNRELKSLVEAGELEKTKIKNRTFYRRP